jgi:hypothetical protein
MPLNEQAEDIRKRFDVEEDERLAYICETDLETLCERDLVAMRHHDNEKNENGGGTTPDFTVEVFKEIVLPHIRREVNESEHFAPLRQVYHALILATWFKKKLREVPAYSKVFESINSDNPHSLITTIRSIKKLGNQGTDNESSPSRSPQPSPRPKLDHATPNAPAFDIADNVEFYQKYIRLFRNGVFRCARAEEGDRPGEIINRLYFSGAVRFDTLPLHVTWQDSCIRYSIPAD